MRIAFPAAEYPDVPVERGRVRIGSSDDNGLVLDAEQEILPSHLQIEVESRRGIVLTVLSEGAKVWVNARPVREKAILRVGDSVVAGLVRMVLKSDEDPVEASEQPLTGTAAEQMGPTLPMLRAHQGPYFGQGLALGASTDFGADPSCKVQLDEPEGVAQLMRVDARAGLLRLKVSAADKQVEVNGVLVSSAMLQSGDQIALQNNRFVVEAPGWGGADTQAPSKTKPAVTQVGRPLVVPPEADETQKGESTVDWVILAAAIVTIGALGVLVYLQFWGT